MGAGAPTVLSDWFMHADACKPQPGCGWCRGAMRAQMRRLSGCADSKGGGARAACSARGDAEMNAGRRVTRRRGNQVDEGVAQGHEQAERQVRRSYSSPPEGGEFDPPTPILRWAARCACASRRRLGRLLAWGVPPPGPPGLRPLWPPGHGPRLVPTTGRQGEAAQAEGRRAVWLLGEISKKWAVRMHGGGFRGACPPGAVERWATRVRAVGGQGSTRSVVPAVHGPQRCPRWNGPQGAALKEI